jgi:hypothetical protein
MRLSKYLPEDGLLKKAGRLTARARMAGAKGRGRRPALLMALLLILAVSATVTVISPMAPPDPALAATAGQSFSMPFPRLAMWFPDSETESLDDIARFDYALLKVRQSSLIAGLKSRNPDMLLLTYLTAVEMPLKSELGAPDSENGPVMKLANEWFLTQVGSRLKTAVNGYQTSLPVADVSVFRVGDVLVIDRELAKVTAVGTTSITVRRGLIPSRSPAASHVAGTRVAALVSFWPGQVEMDITANCPRVTVDRAVGPENWAEYNARTGADQAASAAWDGVLVDRAEGNESQHLVRPLARTIDPTRSNKPVTDNYASFERAWQAGLRGYQASLRSKLGAGKVVFSNCALANLSALNGTSLENFPRTSPRGLSLSWPYRRYWEGNLSWYINALSSGQQPNLSSVLTYDDESEPGGTVYKAYRNPADNPNWRPNYRRMRLGLTTALMGDGFFDYEINTQGHGSLGLLWFDEFDNAGAGQGYLGQPVGVRRLALAPLPTADLLGGDGTFSSQRAWNRWHLTTNPGYAATQMLEGGVARVNVTASAGRVNLISIWRDAVPLKAGSTYTLTFRARADRPLTVWPRLYKATAPYTYWVNFGTQTIGTTWKTFELCMPSSTTDAAARLGIGVGGSVGTIWIDDVRVQTGSRLGVLRRNYDGGVVLVNSTDMTATVELGGTYRRIRGTQVPSVNDGGLVSVAKVPPRDGLIVVGRTTSLSSAGSAVVDVGQTATITGCLTGTSGRVLGGRKVTLESALSPSATTWTTIANTTTSASGGCSFTRAPARTTYYRIRFAGDASFTGCLSPIAWITPRVRLSLASVGAGPRIDKAVTVFGYVEPRQGISNSGVQIQCYRLEGSSWILRQTIWAASANYATAGTKYSAAVLFPTAGSWRVRACRPSDYTAAETYTGWTYVTVGKGVPALSASGSGMVSAASPTKGTSGWLRDSLGNGLVGRRLTVQYAYSAGSSTWTNLVYVTTGASGFWTFKARPTRTTYFRLVFAGDTRYWGAKSPVLKVATQAGSLAR